MASLSSSLPASILPPNRNLVELTTDSKLIYPAVLNAIGNVEKSNGLLPPLVSLVVNYLEVAKKERCGSVFGESEWREHFGSVPRAPALPIGIEEIWQGPCPIFSGKRVSQTHLFVYIPTTVNREPLTLKSLGILAKKYFPKTSDGYRYLWNAIDKQLGDQPTGHSCWVLMTKEGVLGTGSKNYTQQKKIVAAVATTALPAYEVPRALDAAVCIFTRFASSKIRLFSATYTRCEENLNGYQLALGGFNIVGIGICASYDVFDSGVVVVAGLRKFLTP